ncbi:5-methylthioadenosine deaminase [Methylococcus capsulatus]|nr:5-methylthioadenosine deaminase [Methylococcus capsulatus]
MPGFVDTHDHLWQSLIRGCASDRDLYGWLETCVYPMGRIRLSEADAYAAVRLATLGLIGTGVTTVLDWSHAFNPDFVKGNLGALRDSGLRFVFAYWLAPPWGEGCGEAERIRKGLLGHRPAAGFQVATHPTLANLGQLKEAVRCAEELHVPLNVHLGESPKDPQQRQIQALELSGALDGQMLADHAIHLTDREVELLARHRVAVAHNPLSNMRLASGIMRLPEMHGVGLRIGLGLDGGTGDGPDMFAVMKAAVGLQRARLQSASGYPGIADVLRMATLGGAEALGLDKITGSLTPGKRADLIILDPGGANFAPRWDWPSQIVLNGQPANVEYVFVDGRALKSEGKLVEGQEKNAVQAAEAAARRVRAALGDRGVRPLAGGE